MPRVDVDARPYRNTTGLHLAVQFHRPEMVEHLLARGADPTIEDDNHNSTASGWAEVCDDGTDAATRVRELISTGRPVSAGSTVAGKDVTDLALGAVRLVQMPASLDERGDLGFQLVEVGLAFAHLSELVV